MTRILVVDDDIGIREMLQKCLRRAGYDVSIAPDGNAALKLHWASPADLLITDIIMPDKDGIETIMEFQRHSPRVRIIAISGGGKIEGNEYLSIAKMLGAEKTLPKPFELREMLEAVRELLPI